MPRLDRVLGLHGAILVPYWHQVNPRNLARGLTGVGTERAAEVGPDAIEARWSVPVDERVAFIVAASVSAAQCHAASHAGADGFAP
jgi:hypothetical protein